MGVDISNIRQIIHWGPPSTVEQYVQEVGQAGRDGNNSVAVLVNKNNRFATASMISYTKNRTECQHLNFYKHFIGYTHRDCYNKCTCCDVCAVSCGCELCNKL